MVKQRVYIYVVCPCRLCRSYALCPQSGPSQQSQQGTSRDSALLSVSSRSCVLQDASITEDEIQQTLVAVPKWAEMEDAWYCGGAVRNACVEVNKGPGFPQSVNSASYSSHLGLTFFGASTLLLFCLGINFLHLALTFLSPPMY